MTDKQKEYWNNANERYNIKSGATRSGKTFLDYYLIPKRVMEATGDGLIVILGHTKGTIQRNIIEPMQKIYGVEYVSDISSDNTLTLFGKKAYALGADKKNRVDILRGASFEYVYGDEVATWAPEIMRMVESRMDRPNSKFDGTCNPEEPSHWLKKFIDTNQNLYHQHYEIDDNEFLDPEYVSALKRSYEGTVYYDRYILGKWVMAEGIIYKKFANNRDSFEINSKDVPELGKIVVGIDYGGNKSKHAFVATGFAPDWSEIYALSSRRIETGISSNEIVDEFIDFFRDVEETFGRVNTIYSDSAEQILPIDIMNGLRYSGFGNRLIRNSKKDSPNDRIRLTSSLIGASRFYYTEKAESLAEALATSLWDDNAKGGEKRLDNGSTDVDSLDAFEYTIERDARRLLMYNDK